MTCSRIICFSAGLLAFLGASPALLPAQLLTVKGVVNIERKAQRIPNSKDAVVWLKPLDPKADAPTAATPLARRTKIMQQHKHFDPHLLAVQLGTVVDFPNLDPFFHNVFSLFDGKRFDLGLYEAGSSRSVTFTHPGVCFIFCNIHPEMSAIVLVVDTPYFAVSGRNGEIRMENVPPGRYSVSVWHERAKPERPTDFPHEVVLSAANATLSGIRLIDAGQIAPPHKNKYDRDYDPQAPGTGYRVP